MMVVAERVHVLIKLAEPTLWSLPVMLFSDAYVSTGRARWPYLLVGAIYVVLADTASVWWNKYTDQAEDRVNSPHRVELAAICGFESIRRVALGLYAVLGLTALLAAALLSPVLGGAMGLMLLLGWAYSSGPRFKKRVWTSVVFFPVCLVVLPFIAGWLLEEPLSSLPLTVWIAQAYFL